MSKLTDSMNGVKNEALLKCNATSTAIKAVNRQADAVMDEAMGNEKTTLSKPRPTTFKGFSID